MCSKRSNKPKKAKFNSSKSAVNGMEHRTILATRLSVAQERLSKH